MNILTAQSYSLGLCPPVASPVAARVLFKQRVTVARIKEVVADFYSVPLIDMTSARRFRSVARPRQVAMYLARYLTPRSTPDIGRLFGNRDHTTVLHAINVIERLRREDPVLDRDIRDLTEALAV